MKKLFFIFLMTSMLVFSQKKQPKIGLVLSGGGAKGFAHVGVLKEIEKAGIQIDYIGGTSMGAIVGGLYAAGYSASQIEKIVIETDFYNLLRDLNTRKSKPFFEKEHGEKYSLVLPINKGKIGLPQGVSKGQNVLSFLTQLLSPVDSITDFSKLPIPFFCIATDVETGDQVKLTSGSLPLALRASGSFPTLLNPIEINNKLLIDGGIANNFPVDEMKKTGVDIIIGVDVQSKLFHKENIKSALDVLNQISSYQMYKKNPEKIAITDVYIHPDIFEYSVVSFDKSKEILAKGTKIAKNFSKTFDSIAKLQLVKRKPINLVHKDSKFIVHKIEINGNKNHTRAYVLGKLKLQEGDKINYKELATKVSNLSATDNFKMINFSVKNTSDGQIVQLNIIEKKLSASLRLGVHYDLVYKSGVLINVNKKNILSKNDAVSLDFVVGDKPRYDLQYFVDNGFYYSYGFSSRYNSFQTTIKSNVPGINLINLQYRDFTNRAYIQTTFERKFAIGLGLEHQKLLSQTKTISTSTNEPFVFDDSDYLNLYSFLKLDTYDDKYYPKRGFLLDARFKWYMTSTDYNKDFIQFSQVKGKIGFAKSFKKNFTFLFESEAGFTLGDVTSKTFDFLLGGYNQNFINNFIPFYGYDINALSEQSFLKSTFNVRFGVTDKQFIHFLANYARVDNSVLKGGDLFNDTKSGYAFGYSINSIIGPIDLKYSWSPDTKKYYWYFNLGFWF
ncbi:patatin-like phospholipase family protein [Polaribacter gochangensis]|uniref:patatin-like phospholipase family protein n=1 Tax=Polaribacter gochangensis TaxID=3252903 RepID=UPI003904C2D8